MRVVPDANVLVSAFISRGLCSDLLEHAIRTHEVVCSAHILGEFRRNLVSKFGMGARDATESARLLRGRLTFVGPERIQDCNCRDRDDLPVVGTAAAAKAAFLVTGDRDLLVLKEYRGTRIITPRQFWEGECGRNG